METSKKARETKQRIFQEKSLPFRLSSEGSSQEITYQSRGPKFPINREPCQDMKIGTWQCTSQAATVNAS